MPSDLWILITYLRDETMLKQVACLDADSKLGQNYMYWGEDDIAAEYAALFQYDEEILILAVEAIQGKL